MKEVGLETKRTGKGKKKLQGFFCLQLFVHID